MSFGCFCPVYLSVAKKKTYNLGNIVWTVRDEDFIFGMRTQRMVPFEMIPMVPFQIPISNDTKVNNIVILTVTFIIKITNLAFAATEAFVFNKQILL